MLLAKTKTAGRDAAQILAKKKKKTFFTRTNEKTTPSEDQERQTQNPGDGLRSAGGLFRHHQIAVSLRHLRDFERALDHFGAIAKPLEAALPATCCARWIRFRELGLGRGGGELLGAPRASARCGASRKSLAFQRERMGGDATTCVEELERCLALAAAAAKIERQSAEDGEDGEGGGSPPRKERILSRKTRKTSITRSQGSTGVASSRARALGRLSARSARRREKAEKQLGACAKAPEDPGTSSRSRRFTAAPSATARDASAAQGGRARGVGTQADSAEERTGSEALQRELSMRGGNRRALSLRERASGADADPSESFLASSSSLRVLNPEAGGFVRTSRAPRACGAGCAARASRRRSSGCRK